MYAWMWYLAAVGKADPAAGLMAQPSADVGADKVAAAQPTQLAASYSIGMMHSRLTS